jgi:hypothetical protein
MKLWLHGFKPSLSVQTPVQSSAAGGLKIRLKTRALAELKVTANGNEKAISNSGKLFRQLTEVMAAYRKAYHVSNSCDS